MRVHAYREVGRVLWLSRLFSLRIPNPSSTPPLVHWKHPACYDYQCLMSSRVLLRARKLATDSRAPWKITCHINFELIISCYRCIAKAQQKPLPRPLRAFPGML